MRRITAAVACGVAAFCLSPAPAHAQAQGSWVVMTSMSVPYGPERDMVTEYIDSVLVPMSKANPNVKQAYVAFGRFGATWSDLIFVNVYETFEAITAPCGAPCQERAQARQVPEGSDEWNRRIAVRDKYREYFINAQRNIYWVPASRMK